MSDFLRVPYQPVITGTPSVRQPAPNKGTQVPQGGQSFQEILGQVLEQSQPKSLTLSKHAQTRVEQRGVELSEVDMERLEQAVDKAGDKGITDTLVFMNNTAFIVNIPSKVVVTVVDSQQEQEAVFTNINGAVIL